MDIDIIRAANRRRSTFFITRNWMSLLVTWYALWRKYQSIWKLYNVRPIIKLFWKLAQALLPVRWSVHPWQYIVCFRRAVIMSNSKCTPKKEGPKKHIDYSLQFNRWLLKPIGAWPKINTSSSVCRIVILLQIFICTSIIAVPTIPCLLYVLFEAENIQQKLNTMMPLINRFMSSMHYWVLLKRRDDIYKLIRHMEIDWNLVQRIDEREVMLQYAKFGRFITIICGIMLQGGCLLFALRQSMKTATITIGNETFITHLTTCPIYSKIIDTRFTPLNEIALVLQNLVILVISFCTAGGCSLAAVFAIHACGQLNVLYAWLHELVENQTKKNDKAEQKLAAIIEHHLRILRYFTSRHSIKKNTYLL